MITLLTTHSPYILGAVNNLLYVGNLSKKAGRLVKHYRIDGYVIANNDVMKCDYLLRNDDRKNAYPIELKGHGIRHAIEQLESAERILQQDLAVYQKHFRIVYHSNTHAIYSSDYTKFIKKNPGRVQSKTGVLEEII